MLSKVAERVYWTARYLERVENTARLIRVYDNLMFDLPRSVNFGWYNLITINSAQKEFADRFKVQDERNVVKFLLADDTTSSSILSSLSAIRENVRTTRDVVPEDTWELTNELNLYVTENIQLGVNRKGRHEFLDGVIKGCQQILGLLYGTMPHDPAWDFLRLGRNLERADMTTRILDAGVAAVLQVVEEDAAVNSRQIIWGAVLRSLGATQSYRQTTRSAVTGDGVVYYLLEDLSFPRTIAHCLDAIIDSAERLPRSKEIVAILKENQSTIFDDVDYEELGEPLRDYLNDLQTELASIHTHIAATWFPELH
ncbi:alpha-E domain-containing protein [Teredinibacter turnerae]|uniref:alpha-E domain-containing protein n=1 Tax=Teredinibacter turnerae TaxID=2426 RepID=UPI000365C44B|nr:alpha-E domain-containing protein [Teredinibacter turnerae]